MSRIRSVHPGFFRDDRLVPCSAFARLLFIGLGVEADDKGIFEWKPVTIKMSVFPGDNVDVAELLAELVDADAIRTFEVRGKRYGAIRNFRKYQKPKTPNDVHPLADGIAEYVSLPQKGETPAADDDAFPQKGEKSFQMEEGGGKREEKKEIPPNPQGGMAGDPFDLVEAGFPRSPHYNRDKAIRAYRRLNAEDRDALRSKANSFGAWWAAEQVKRNRSMADSLPFAPPLDKWISEGAWRSFGESQAAVHAHSDYVVLRRDDPLCAALAQARGKPLIFGDKGTVTVAKSEIDRLRSAA